MRDSGLSGRLALVTGAGGGIGAAVVRLLVEEGARVVATDLPSTALSGLAFLNGVRVEPLDVSDAARPRWKTPSVLTAKTRRHSASRRMGERGKGAFVTVSSNAAGVPRHAMAAYAASKAAPSSSAHMPVCIGVRVEPGATMLQRTPFGPSSSPRQRVNMVAAAFDAA
jgi:2,3-dihydro-2,3-dihydroxybenzoate dehydrogenase